MSASADSRSGSKRSGLFSRLHSKLSSKRSVAEDKVSTQVVPVVQPVDSRSTSTARSSAPAAGTEQITSTRPSPCDGTGVSEQHVPQETARKAEDDGSLPLDAFHVIDVDPGSELEAAQNELHESLKRLEGELSKQRGSSQFTSQAHQVLKPVRPQMCATSFTALAKELQYTNDVSRKTIAA